LTHRYLLLDPKQRKVMIVEPLFLPIWVKELMADLLLGQFNVPALSFMPAAVLATIPTGNMTGLVVDAGYHETTVIAVTFIINTDVRSMMADLYTML
jgi:actin-related protein 10